MRSAGAPVAFAETPIVPFEKSIAVLVALVRRVGVTAANGDLSSLEHQAQSLLTALEAVRAIDGVQHDAVPA